MTCSCKCCCGCCCDGEAGSQSLEPACEAPKVFHGKGTICDVCCDLGEIREDITTEEDCPGTWVTNGRCLENPCVECEADEDCCIGSFQPDTGTHGPVTSAPGFSASGEVYWKKTACPPDYENYEIVFIEHAGSGGSPPSTQGYEVSPGTGTCCGGECQYEPCPDP